MEFFKNHFIDMNILNHNNLKWKLLEKLYNENYLYKDNKKPKIPKIIHQIWLGDKYPEKYHYYTEKLMKINKGWEYKLWTDADVDSFKLKNIKLFNNISNLGAKSDIFRYEILERIGGVYIDTDFDSVKSFDDLLYLDFFAGTQDKEMIILNSIMASIPNHKYISNIVYRLQKNENFNDNIDGVMNNTGPYFINDIFFNIINENDNVVIFPRKFFFPFPNKYRHVKQDKNYIKFTNSFNNKNTYVVHLWHTTWQ